MLHAIGGLTLIALFFYLITSHWEKQERKGREAAIEENRKSIYGDETPEQRKERQQRREYYEDLEHKRNILNRTYAYKYEEILYDIFISKDIFTETTLISKIKERLNLEYDEAYKLFKEWEKHDLIFSSSVNNPPVYELGFTLRTHANIISKSDLTLEKWREQNNYKNNDFADITSKDIEEIEDYYNKDIDTTYGRKWFICYFKNLKSYEIESIDKALIKNQDDKKTMYIYHKNGNSENYPLIYNSKLCNNEEVDPKSIRKFFLERQGIETEMILIDGAKLLI